MIKAWLTVVWTATKKQGSLGEFKTDSVFKVYIAGLRKYPADLVCEALSGWTSTPKPNGAHHWWPSLGEIEDAIRGPSETRRLIQSAVKGWSVDKATHERLSFLYNQLSVLEHGDFTFPIKHLQHARRWEQVEGISKERARVEGEIAKLKSTGGVGQEAGPAREYSNGLHERTKEL